MDTPTDLHGGSQELRQALSAAGVRALVAEPYSENHHSTYGGGAVAQQQAAARSPGPAHTGSVAQNCAAAAGSRQLRGIGSPASSRPCCARPDEPAAGDGGPADHRAAASTCCSAPSGFGCSSLPPQPLVVRKGEPVEGASEVRDGAALAIGQIDLTGGQVDLTGGRLGTVRLGHYVVQLDPPGDSSGSRPVGHETAAAAGGNGEGDAPPQQVVPLTP